MKLTNDDFEMFKKECEFWLDFFHLRDYKVYYEFKDIREAIADCTSNSVDRVATIRLTSSKKDFDIDVKMSAFHEVCELLLSDMHAYLSDFYSEAICQQQTHYIIRKLENSIYKSHKENYIEDVEIKRLRKAIVK